MVGHAMTIHWKALEEHFLIFWGKCILRIFLKQTQVLGIDEERQITWIRVMFCQGQHDCNTPHGAGQGKLHGKLVQDWILQQGTCLDNTIKS
jgi:hypothetical protein